MKIACRRFGRDAADRRGSGRDRRQLDGGHGGQRRRLRPLHLQLLPAILPPPLPPQETRTGNLPNPSKRILLQNKSSTNNNATFQSNHQMNTLTVYHQYSIQIDNEMDEILICYYYYHYYEKKM